MDASSSSGSDKLGEIKVKFSTGARRALFSVLFVAMIAGAASIWYFGWHVKVDEQLWIAGLLALLPAAMIVQQAIYLGNVKARFISEDNANVIVEHRRSALEAARRADEKYFSFDNLAWRFGPPAVLVLLIVLVGYYVLFVPGEGLQGVPRNTLEARWPSLSGIILGLRCGAVGAFVFVLLELGQRTFRHDITSGVAYWCAVVLAVGPILAGFLANVGGGFSAAGGAAGATGGTWSESILFFGAGFSPRYVARLIDETLRKRFPTQAQSSGSPRSIPLGMVRGMTMEIQDRFAEEGISDVVGLAMADPHKLLRNTSFDRRQILSLIDNALLINALPKNWDKLEEAGITGAIDLAWYDGREHDVGTAAAAMGGTASAPQEGTSPATLNINQVKSLAQAAGCDAGLLRDVISRLYEDAQVQLIWVLYQVNSSEVSGESAAIQRRNGGSRSN